MRRDNLVRMAALVILCGLVYYFSFDQGREAVKAKVGVLEEEIRRKDRIIEELNQEIRKLRAGTVSNTPEKSMEFPASAQSEIPQGTRINIRLNASRILFEARLVLTCQEIDPGGKAARIQVNLIQQGRILVETIQVGQAMRFSLEDREWTLILEEVHGAFIVLRLV